MFGKNNNKRCVQHIIWTNRLVF